MNFSDFHYEVMDYISNHEYIQACSLYDVFPNQKRRLSEVIDSLLKNKLIDYTPVSDDENYLISKDIEQKHLVKFDPIFHLFLTESGHAVLDEYLKSNCDHSSQNKFNIGNLSIAFLSSVAAVVTALIAVLHYLNPSS